MMGLLKGRGKQEASVKPSRSLPDPASDVFEKSGKLEFPSLNVPALSQASASQPSVVLRNTEQPSYDEIRQFEDAVSGISSPHASQTRQVNVESRHDRFSYGFFHEVERRLKEQGHGLDVSSLVSKMKQYHISKEDGSPFYYSMSDLHGDIDARMSDLKDLEARWLDAKRSLERAEQDLAEHEKSISAKLNDVQELLKHAKVAERLEQQTGEEHAFVLCNGAKLKSLLELAVAIRTMSDETFASHVSAERNDFSSWVRDVFGMSELATKLSEARDRQTTVKVLTEL